MKTIKKSPFGNTYGGLLLAENDKGEKMLVMEDSFGADYFGPLTDGQAQAFHTLCEVKQA